MAAPDIAALILRTAMGERAAFRRLYDATSAKLFGICLRILKDRAEAEEALQEVFVKIWLRADRFSVTGQSPMSWLIAVARNQAIDRLRSRREAVALDEAAPTLRDPAPGPEARAVAAAEIGRLGTCLDQLEQDRARALRGAYIAGESYADLAQRFGVPLNTMRTWLRRSLMRLRACMERTA